VDSAEIGRADNPVAIGEAQADLERLVDLRNQAAWDLREPTPMLRWQWTQVFVSCLHTVEPGVRSREPPSGLR
jgi:hypothetical protein